MFISYTKQTREAGIMHTKAQVYVAGVRTVLRAFTIELKYDPSNVAIQNYEINPRFYENNFYVTDTHNISSGKLQVTCSSCKPFMLLEEHQPVVMMDVVSRVDLKEPLLKFGEHTDVFIGDYVCL